MAYSLAHGAGTADSELFPNAMRPGRDLAETAWSSRHRLARLSSDRLDAQLRSRGLSAKLASTDRSYAAAKARLQDLAQVQAKYDFLSAQLAAAKRDYASLSDAYEEAVIETTTGQSRGIGAVASVARHTTHRAMEDRRNSNGRVHHN